MRTAGRLLDNHAISRLFAKYRHFYGHLRLYGRSHRNGNWRHAKEKSLVNKQEPVIGKQDIGKQDIGKRGKGRPVIENQDIGKQDIGKQDIGKKDIGKQDIGKQDIGKQDIGKKDIGK
ncbi:MAG: hypothetical protein LBG86_01155, partial [Puniceicoccales bacterium]|nr:hypothetical protein [Puniceicoccales bacterium]